MSLKDEIASIRRYILESMVPQADAFESKRLRKILLSAAERLGDAERQPQLAEPMTDAQTGEPNPMTDGIKANVDAGGDPNAQHVNVRPLNPFDLAGVPPATQPPGAQTGEPNPTQG
jgi:hypothetical protein